MFLIFLVETVESRQNIWVVWLDQFVELIRGFGHFCLMFFVIHRDRFLYILNFLSDFVKFLDFLGYINAFIPFQIRMLLDKLLHFNLFFVLFNLVYNVTASSVMSLVESWLAPVLILGNYHTLALSFGPVLRKRRPLWGFTRKLLQWTEGRVEWIVHREIRSSNISDSSETWMLYRPCFFVCCWYLTRPICRGQLKRSSLIPSL
jgi:hypothetical protein